MTLQEVADVASVLVGKQVDLSLANLYLSEGLILTQAKYPTACPITCVTLETNDSHTRHPLPHNNGVYKVYFNKKRTFEYDVDEYGIRFFYPGEYQVYYYRTFTGKLSHEEPVPIAPEYEAELCKYVAFSVLRADDPSNRVADRLVEEFYDNCTAIHQSMSARGRNYRRPLAVPRWK